MSRLGAALVAAALLGASAREAYADAGRVRFLAEKLRSEDFRVKCAVPGMGLQEPVYHGRRAICQQRRQESDSVHIGVGLANLAVCD